MRASRTRRLLATALAAGLAACGSEPPSAPSAAAWVAPSIDGPSMAAGGRRSSVESSTITIDPSRTAIYGFGNHFLYVPAGALCTLDTPYGPGEWDTPCERAIHPVRVHVVVNTVDGHPSATFYPDMRFAPAASNDYRNWVFLGLKVQGQLRLDANYSILYRPTGSSELIDESLTDPTLRAFRSVGHTVVRRLKHFSGYNVSLGGEEQLCSAELASLGLCTSGTGGAQ